MTIAAKENEALKSIRIKNPCIGEFIPLTIEKGEGISHPDDSQKYEILDKSIDDNAKFYKAIIKLGDEKIGEFHTRYVVHFDLHSDEGHSKHIANVSNPLKSFEQNVFSQEENCMHWDKDYHFCKLVKDGEDYVFKHCNIAGKLDNDNELILPARLISFNKKYVNALSDLQPDSVYIMTKSKLHERFSNKEDSLYSHPIEIREFSTKSGPFGDIFVPKKETDIVSFGKLIGTINHEYGLFRDSTKYQKSEFIFSDTVTKGKDVMITDKDCTTNHKDERKIESEDRCEPKDECEPEGFLFLAKFKDKSDYPGRECYDCRDHSYNNYSELKLGEYALGFANNKGCTKIISNTHLDENIDLKHLFESNKGKVIQVSPFMLDMHDLWDTVQCATNPTYSDSMFI